jgi:hypothetical protein
VCLSTPQTLKNKKNLLSCSGKFITMKKAVLPIIFCIFSSFLFAQSSNDENQIRTVLETQRLAWNSGNLDVFMQGYWQSDSVMFICNSGVTYGWQNTLNNYKNDYPDTAAMGKLIFNIIQVKRLSAIYFSVVGKWDLTRSIGNVGGHFTLLFRKVKNKWVIVSDHSS